jgi:Ca-activated chloride channel homolog
MAVTSCGVSAFRFEFCVRPPLRNVLAGMGLRTALLVCLVAAASAQQPFRVDVKLVNTGFVVRDAAGRLVTNLERDDFEVFEDGAAQKIAFFGRSADVPLDLGLVVDVSGSQDPFIRQHHKDLEAFLASVLGPKDRAFLVCFGNHLRLAQDFSSSARDLAAALKEFDAGEHPYAELGPRELRIQGTAFFDAIYYSIREKLARGDMGRRALIVFSDGEDNSSAHNLLDAIETAQGNDVMLFSVRYTDTKQTEKAARRLGVADGLNSRNRYGTSVMERAARETGGAAFDARAASLAEHFRDIGDQLRAAYELGYYTTNPVADGTFHKISIRVKRSGLTVRAKTGYFAPAADCQGKDCGSPPAR